MKKMKNMKKIKEMKKMKMNTPLSIDLALALGER
jgi:hypothetical protein